MNLTATLKETVRPRIWIAFSLFLVFYVLVIGVPAPPGLLYQVSGAYLRSQPGYADMMSGLVSQDQLIQNVDVYNSYLLSVIVVLILNFVAYILLFALCATLVWQYLLTGRFSLKGFWRVLIINTLWIIFASIIGALLYAFFLFVASFGPQWWADTMSVCFELTVLILLLITIVLNRFIVVKTVAAAIADTLSQLRKNGWRILLAGVAVSILLLIISFVWYIPGVSLNALLLILTFFVLIGFAWLHSYVAVLTSGKPKKQN